MWDRREIDPKGLRRDNFPEPRVARGDDRGTGSFGQGDFAPQR